MLVIQLKKYPKNNLQRHGKHHWIIYLMNMITVLLLGMKELYGPFHQEDKLQESRHDFTKQNYGAILMQLQHTPRRTSTFLLQ